MQAIDDDGDDEQEYTDLTRLPVQALYCDWPDLEQVVVAAGGRHLLLRAPHMTGLVRLTDPVRRGVWCDAHSSCIANAAVLPWPHHRLTTGCILRSTREGTCADVAFAVGDAHASVMVAYNPSSAPHRQRDVKNSSSDDDDESSTGSEDENCLLGHRVQTFFVGQEDDWHDALRGLGTTTLQDRSAAQQPLRSAYACYGHAIRALLPAAQDGSQLLCQRDGDVHEEGGNADAVQTLWRASLATSQVWPVKLAVSSDTHPRDAPARLFDLRAGEADEGGGYAAQSSVCSGRAECAVADGHGLSVYDSAELSPRVSFPFRRTAQADAATSASVTRWRVLTAQRSGWHDAHYLVTLGEDKAGGPSAARCAKGSLWTACLDARMPRRPVWVVACRAHDDSAAAAATLSTDDAAVRREVCHATTMRAGEFAVYHAPASCTSGDAVVHTIRYDTAVCDACVHHTLHVSGDALRMHDAAAPSAVRAMIWGGSALHLVCSRDETA